MVDGAAAVDRRHEHGAVWAEVGEADAIAVDRREQQEKAGEFEQGLAAGYGAGAELQRG